MNKLSRQRVRPVPGAVILGILVGLFTAGCGKRDTPQPAPSSVKTQAEAQAVVTTDTALADSAPAAAAAEAASPAAAAEVVAKPTIPVPPPTSPAGEAPPTQDPTAETVVTPPDTTPPEPAAIPTSSVTDPGGLVEVEAAKEGLSRVGAAKCKTCHAVQFASWSASAHARRTPPLDCESCHGAGSEYKAMAVMKDPAKARAAGLVQPDRAFCVTCHQDGWNDDMLSRAHAHKAAPASR